MYESDIVKELACFVIAFFLFLFIEVSAEVGVVDLVSVFYERETFPIVCVVVKIANNGCFTFTFPSLSASPLSPECIPSAFPPAP